MKNDFISASAGTGKTFALATRVIRLLLLGVEPQTIVALTFSRAAAGEIFNRIAGRLASAAADAKAAARESAAVFAGLKEEQAAVIRGRHGEPLTREVFAGLLRGVIGNQHLSMIGTLDSFMWRMAQMFPLELGLGGAMALMDDYEAKRAQVSGVERLLGADAEGEGTEEFYEAFRFATMGKEGKTFFDKLLEFVEDWHTIYLDYPDREKWGGSQAIWGSDKPPLVRRGDLAELAERFGREVGAAFPDRAAGMAQISDFARGFGGSLSDMPVPLKNLLGAFSGHGVPIAEFNCDRKKTRLSAEQELLAADLVETLLAVSLEMYREHTRGLHGLMRRFEAGYAETRGAGKLVYADIPRLIIGLEEGARRNIEYRFDTKFQHWLLDEFQDTSRTQWDVVRPLIEEVIEGGDERSVLLVGDVKQAIYGWRNGDAAIFEKEKDSGFYEVSPLKKSFRYCPEIAGAVNAVFDGAGISGFLQDSAAGKRWARLWETHESAVGAGGQVAVLEADGEKIEDYAGKIAEELNANRPWEKGLAAAVLVRTNEQGRQLAELLRAEEIPVTWEGDNPISDTPVVTALLHLIALADHPDHTLAARHIEMTPLLEIFGSAKAVPARVAGDVARLGLAGTLRDYIARLGKMDAFTESRLASLVREAAGFEAGAKPGTRISDFVELAGDSSRRDVADPATVKLLSIHRAKGLGFDYVIVPLVEDKGIDKPKRGEVLLSKEKGWLLQQPMDALVEKDAVLSEAAREMRDEKVFEALCARYVALTRAKKYLSIYIKPLAASGKPTATKYFSQHVRDTLGVSAGMLRVKEADVAARTADAGNAGGADKLPLRIVAGGFEPRRVTPSGAVEWTAADGAFFAGTQAGGGMERGTRLHEALQKIEWLEEGAGQPDGIARGDIDLTVASAFRDALRKPRGAEVLALWREREFEVALGGEWISGKVDRVVFVKTGGATRAVVYDYKSNARRKGEASADFERRMAEKYGPQMEVYRRAVSALAKLPPESVETVLLLTATAAAAGVIHGKLQ
ncbi:MAG: UvrD-helicase domain-containing protein [Opitutaceae bacterium]|jgi:ATP-dependent exoDNAse (exonuclease V) beta subunit|nr:UvrD-helicase domain-containing protein [Opitutaceae bacterium]